MSAAVEALRGARAAGITVVLEGGTLLLEANAAPPEEVIAALSRHNPIVQDAQAGSLDTDCRIIEWLNEHPAACHAGHCAWCGTWETRDAVVLPFGTQPGTHTWLHAECWRPWHEARRAKALAACWGAREAEP